MLTIDKAQTDAIIDGLLGNNDLTASPEVWYGLHQIRKLPATEIVRCGECIYWHNDGCLHPVFGCHDANYDEFCSTGKRKEMKCDD